MSVLGLGSRGGHSVVETQGHVPLEDTDCIRFALCRRSHPPCVVTNLCCSCGQCTAVCPVGAIIERPHVHAVQWHLQHKHGKTVVVQTAPSVRTAISEEFGLPPGTLTAAQLVAGLRECNFDAVFDTNFTADLTAVEESAELIRRLGAGGPFPMFTSCCPAWVNLVEQTDPTLLPNLSSCKSPQGMLGALIK